MLKRLFRTFSQATSAALPAPSAHKLAANPAGDSSPALAGNFTPSGNYFPLPWRSAGLGSRGASAPQREFHSCADCGFKHRPPVRVLARSIRGVARWRRSRAVSPPRSSNQTCADFPHSAFGPRSIHPFAHGRLAVVLVRRTKPSVSSDDSSGSFPDPVPRTLYLRHNHWRNRGQACSCAPAPPPHAPPVGQHRPLRPR